MTHVTVQSFLLLLIGALCPNIHAQLKSSLTHLPFIMKTRFLALLVSPILLSQCVVDENSNAPATAGSYGQPLTAVRGQSSVKIMEGDRAVSTCTTASPNVEEAKFITEQEQIVVKSRGNHGPATVQLFDTQTGKQEARVMAYDIQGGQPAWAAGMGE